MKESVYKTYEELPLFLNAETVAKVLGIAPSSSYELMHEADFPVLKVGSRMVVPKEVRNEQGGQKLFSHAQRNFFSGIISWGVRGVRLPASLRKPSHPAVLARLQNHWLSDADERQHSAQAHLLSG